MIRLLAISFVLLLSLTDISRVMVLCHYASNLELYANEFCENKEEPDLQCYGSCQLSKELQTVESGNQDDQLPVRKIEIQEVSAYDLPEVLSVASQSVVCKPSGIIFKKDLHFVEVVDDIFHPPQV